MAYNKTQIIIKIQWPNYYAIHNSQFDILNLKFICYLYFAIWNLNRDVFAEK